MKHKIRSMNLKPSSALL